MEIKKIGQNNAGIKSPSDRFRVVISDGVHTCQAMLATQQNRLVEDDQVSQPAPAPPKTILYLKPSSVSVYLGAPVW